VGKEFRLWERVGEIQRGIRMHMSLDLGGMAAVLARMTHIGDQKSNEDGSVEDG
jgi:hypothetical protein